MKKAVLALLVLLSCSTVAHASILDAIGGWISGELIAVILSAVMAILSIVAGVLYTKISRTFREAGEFLMVLGDALSDRKLTSEEIKTLIKEAKDILAVWRN